MGRQLQQATAGVASLGGIAPIELGGTGTKDVTQVPSIFGVVAKSEVGKANGPVGLDASGFIPDASMPSNLARRGNDGKLPSAVLGITTGFGISGPSTMYQNTVTTFTISNLDMSTTYTLTGVIGGTASLSGNTITFTAGNTAGAGGFTVGGKTVNFTIVAPVVNQPSITSPTSGGGGEGSSVSFTSSAFATTGQSDTQASADWQIATDTGFSNVVASVTASATNLTSWTASGLSANTVYYARVRYRGTAITTPSAWSSIISFATKAAFYPQSQQAKLLASDKAANDYFGSAVALSGDGNTCAVGAYAADPSGLDAAGAAYIFTRNGTTWTQQTKLIASDKAADDTFGYSVALSGDGNTCAVGGYGVDPSGISNAGAAYIFTRSGSTWMQQAKLVANNAAMSDNSGLSIAISGDGNTCVVGAFQATRSLSYCGAAFVFTRSGSVWSQQAQLLASDAATSAYFGWSIALSSDGNTCAVGANGDDPSGLGNAGAAYIFTRSGVNWTQQAKLTASDKAASDEFGYSIALSGDGNTCAVGAVGADPLGLGNAGAAYIFTRSGVNWTQQAKLYSANAAVGDNFSVSITLNNNGNTCAVGVYWSDPSGVGNAGSVVIFTRNGTTWTQQIELVAIDKAFDDRFGQSVAFSSDGNTCAIGACMSDPSAVVNAGAVYIFA